MNCLLDVVLQLKLPVVMSSLLYSVWEEFIEFVDFLTLRLQPSIDFLWKF